MRKKQHHHLITCLWPILLLLAACSTPPKNGPAPPPVAIQKAPVPVGVVAVSAERPKATGTSEDARRHLLRGTAAIEMARSEAELSLAAEEFRMATEISPDMAEAWFNLGAVQEKIGQYKEAAASYREYLALAPDAEDAPRLRDELIKLEFREEQRARVVGRAGIWVDQGGNFFRAVVNGDHLTFEGTRHILQDEIKSTYSLVGKLPTTSVEKVTYQLVVRGQNVIGAWTRSETTSDVCKIPGESADVTGQIDDAQRRIILHYPRTLFSAATQMSLLSNDTCREVAALGKKDVETSLYGPLPPGGIGVALDGFHEWWDGGFSAVQFGWQGRVALRGIAEGSVAWNAGLRNKDEIFYIDNMAVREMTPAQVVFALRGEPGTEVILQVSRDKGKTVSSVAVIRFDITKNAGSLHK